MIYIPDGDRNFRTFYDMEKAKQYAVCNGVKTVKAYDDAGRIYRVFTYDPARRRWTNRRVRPSFEVKLQ